PPAAAGGEVDRSSGSDAPGPVAFPDRDPVADDRLHVPTAARQLRTQTGFPDPWAWGVSASWSTITGPPAGTTCSLRITSPPSSSPLDADRRRGGTATAGRTAHS